MVEMKLIEALMRHETPSFSPQIGRTLIGIEKKVLAASKAESDSEVARMLATYAMVLSAVCNVGILHQDAVITKLGMLDKLS